MAVNMAVKTTTTAKKIIIIKKWCNHTFPQISTKITPIGSSKEVFSRITQW